jgi:hypothetical protein
MIRNGAMMESRHMVIIICIPVFMLVSSVIDISASEPLVLSRMDQPITLDGILDEPEWQTIDSIELTMHTPNFGNESLYPTNVRIAYDDTYLYVGAICYSPPDEIFATSYRRDLMAPSTDYFNVVLDTFNDNENGLAFAVMPTGARLDFAISNDAQGDMNVSWNAFWDASVSIHEEGWSVEMRIPFSSLRFQDRDGRVEMGLIVNRTFAGRASTSTFPPIPPDWGFWSFIKPSQAQKVIMEGVYSRKPVYVTPYALGGIEQQYNLNAQETAYRRFDEQTYNYGLDLKYGLSNNFTLDLTLNTDFAQVEADNQQVNLTRFSLFFPEKRLFFQERASVFTFGKNEQSNQLFYSRRIGLHEGEQVPILAGLRLVGRAGKWDVGILNMQTARDNSILVDEKPLPSENFGVVRLRRQILNPYSYAGGMVTSRYNADGRYNIAYGVDGIFRVFADDYLTVSFAQTYENDISSRFTDPEHTRVHAQWERRSLAGFGYDLSFSHSGEKYNPEMGFIFRRNYTRFGDKIFYGWFPGDRSILQRHQVYLNGEIFMRNPDGNVESYTYGPSWEATLKSGEMVSFRANVHYENLIEGFSLPGDAEIPSGIYRTVTVSMHYDNFGGKFRRIISGTAGGFYDGMRYSFNVTPTVVLSKHLQVGGYYQYENIRFSDRGQKFIGHIGRLRIDGSLNIKISAAAFIQYNSAFDVVTVNARLRYNPREGYDLYLVYNEGMNTNRYRTNIPLTLTNNRTILLKFSYTVVSNLFGRF